jgi:hypothetical protein
LFPIHFEGIFFCKRELSPGLGVVTAVTDPNDGQTSLFRASERELILNYAPGEYYFVGVVFFEYKKQATSFHIVQNDLRADIRGIRQFLDLSEVFFVEKSLLTAADGSLLTAVPSPSPSWHPTKENSSEFYLQNLQIPDEHTHYCCFRGVLPSYKVSKANAIDAGGEMVRIELETEKERHLSGMAAIATQLHAGYLLWKPALVSNSVSDFDVDLGCADSTPDQQRAGATWRRAFDVQSLAAACFKLLAKDLGEGPYSPLPASVRKFIAQDSALKQNLQLYPYLYYPYTKVRVFFVSF